jgi:hypothetical protein
VVENNHGTPYAQGGGKGPGQSKAKRKRVDFSGHVSFLGLFSSSSFLFYFLSFSFETFICT